MLVQTKTVFSYLLILIPLFLITGPAIPDIIITLSAVFGIIYYINRNEYKGLLKINFIRISLLFWTSLLIISFFSINKSNSFQDSIIFLRFLLLPIFLYFIFLKDKKLFEIILIFILILIVLICIDTLYQFFNYTSKDGFGRDIIGFKSNWYGRLSGPFGDELIPGSYVSKFGLFGFVYLISKRKLENRFIIHALYLTLILLVTFASGERMALATFCMGLILLFIFLKNNRLAILITFILGAVLIYLIIKIHPFYNDYKIIESTQYHQGLKVEKFYKCNEDSDEICSKIIELQPSFLKVIQNFNSSAYGEIYSLSYKMFINNPITGTGINNFKYLCNHNTIYKNVMINYECASHPHNIYIHWLAEGGLIVFSIFILYLLFLLRFIIINDGENKYKFISLIIILIMFWPIMSTGSLIKNWYGITTFFIIGLCMCLSSFKSNH